mmetsp:Transcript_29635/g.55490  ORF Transcript_29635/g.55490 Transcript_29635/m.55490 type:complete len:90 (+) Transcript_29635:225-494(+)
MASTKVWTGSHAACVPSRSSACFSSCARMLSKAVGWDSDFVAQFCPHVSRGILWPLQPCCEQRGGPCVPGNNSGLCGLATVGEDLKPVS